VLQKLLLALFLLSQHAASYANLGITPKSIATQAINTSASDNTVIYDAALRLARLTNENERSYAFEYDALDRPVSEQRLDGSRISTTYDASGWPTSTTHHPILGDDYLFVSHPIVTATGELSSRATPPSKPIRTTYERNLLGQLLYKRTGEIRTDYTYDAAGQLLDISDWQEHHGPVLTANSATKTASTLCTLITRCSFAYTAMGDLQAQHTFDSLTGETQTLEHTITHTYDALGNRTATTLPDGRSLNHLHYGSGHLHQINLDGHIISDFERNALHQEIGRSHGAQLDSHYRLDPLGRTLHLQTRSSGGNVLRKDYNYSATGELLASSSQRPSTQGLSSHSQQHRYDALGRIQSSVLNNNSSNINNNNNNNNNNQTEHFSYDPAGNLLDRLDNKTGLGSNNSNHLNNLNNPIGSSGSSGSNGFIQDNLLRVFEDKRYFYDGHGRLLVKKSGRHQTQYFEWDDSHQLQAVHTVREDTDKATKTVASTRFTYDPLGRRTSKTHHDGQQASTTRFAWDGLKLLSETRETSLGETVGDKTSLYIYADTGSYEPLARVDTVALKTAQNDDAFAIKTIANLAINTSAAEEKSPKTAKIFYFHNDLNGLPQELSQDGQFVWRASYKVWGNVVSEEWTGSYAKSSAKAKTETQNLRFQGQYYDVETGLHYNTFRFYDPDIGRFTSPDPIGLEGGDNLYAYAPNPVTWADPWGLAPKNGTYGGERGSHTGGETNHVPARGSYKSVPNAPSKYSGPAFHMDKADHRGMASTGSSKAAERYRLQQNQHIKNGRWDKAMKMDIQETTGKFDSKYTARMQRMVGAAQKQGLITPRQAKALTKIC
jgi:RHS repeat-associated protein